MELAREVGPQGNDFSVPRILRLADSRIGKEKLIHTIKAESMSVAY